MFRPSSENLWNAYVKRDPLLLQYATQKDRYQEDPLALAHRGHIVSNIQRAAVYWKRFSAAFQFTTSQIALKYSALRFWYCR
jgi:hypothetical protein